MNASAARRGFSWPSVAILGLILGSFLKFFLVDVGDGRSPVAGAVAAAAVLALYVAMLKTGDIGRWRRVFFVLIAACFAPSFIAELVESRGAMSLSAADIFKNETPFCHIVIPMTILPHLSTGKFIFPARLEGHYASVYSMVAVWFIATVTLGRGWCSWVCFYGGWDDGFSRSRKKALLPLEKHASRFRVLPKVVLFFVVFASLWSLAPVYCTWLCPFKTITEFNEIVDAGSYIALIAAATLFLSLAVVLPALTRRRTQCSAFCPFGAFQSLLDRFSPYGVKIDRAKCVDCGACSAACPSLALDAAVVKSGNIPATCVKCGDCVSACARGAIDYRFKWQDAGGGSLALRLRERVKADGPAGKALRALLLVLDEIASPRALLATNGVLIGAIVGGSFMSDTLVRLWRLATTGSFIG